MAGAGAALLVDDEELVRASTADMLSDLGYAVVEASSAEEALRLVDGGRAPDVVVTDHLMPGMTGTELARTLKARRLAQKELVIFGYAEDDGIAPDLPRLTKPFRQAELARASPRCSKEGADDRARRRTSAPVAAPEIAERPLRPTTNPTADRPLSAKHPPRQPFHSWPAEKVGPEVRRSLSPLRPDC